MSDFNARAAFPGESINAATEEEIAEFIQSKLKELAIMACFIAMPSERRKKMEDAIALFQGCVGCYYPNRSTKLIGCAAANCR
ncbi:MAG: hypothetical protein ACLP7P_20220 [Rhodomicrobium sp.]